MAFSVSPSHSPTGTFVLSVVTDSAAFHPAIWAQHSRELRSEDPVCPKRHDDFGGEARRLSRPSWILSPATARLTCDTCGSPPSCARPWSITSVR